MFHDREDGGRQLAALLADYPFQNLLILAIPRGGVVTGAALARELGGELDVVLSRKLRAPGRPELAIGAISETGEVSLNQEAVDSLDVDQEYLRLEKEHQLSEIFRRKRLFRSVRPAATVSGRSVIVTDDGIATGSTMMAALQTVRRQGPLELIVAVPVAPRERLVALENRCDKVVCLQTPEPFWAVGQFYQEFATVEDDQVVDILKHFATQPGAAVKSNRAKADSSTTSPF